jgi:hypothetical protein
MTRTQDKRDEGSGSTGPPDQTKKRGGHAGTWLVAVMAAAASGVAVYFICNKIDPLFAPLSSIWTSYQSLATMDEKVSVAQATVAIAQDLLIIVGIVLAALAASRSRYFAAYLQIQAEPKLIIEQDGNKRYLIVSVKITNLGKSAVTKEKCLVAAKKIEEASSTRGSADENNLSEENLQSVNLSLQPEGGNSAQILPSLQILRPNEEATEDVMFLLPEDAQAVEVAVRFKSSAGRIRSFIFGTKTAEDLTERRILDSTDGALSK